MKKITLFTLLLALAISPAAFAEEDGHVHEEKAHSDAKSHDNHKNEKEHEEQDEEKHEKHDEHEDESAK